MMTRIEQQTMDSIIAINRKMKDQRTPDWEQRRYEIAKDVMLGQINHFGEDPEKAATFGVYCAEVLITKLKKGGQND